MTTSWTDDTDEPFADPWAFLDAPDDLAEPDLDNLTIIAVLVTTNAARWLPETLAGLAALDPPPDHLIVVDNASSDDTPELLAAALADGTVNQIVPGRAGDGFGAAVARALAESTRDDRGYTGRHAAVRDPPQEWLWLLHDDGVVAPDTLGRLLAHVADDDKIAVTGPKLLRPALGRANRSRSTAGPVQLSEIGVTIAGTGRRELGLEPGEVDQGQHDQPQEVLGVSTCGMLVRREVWDELNGLTGSLPIFRDGVDFGWRARLAGHRVMTTPSARIVHRQVGHAGLRPDGAAGRHPARMDRTLGLHVVMGHATGAARVPVWTRLVWGCLLRTLGYLIGKAPGRSVDELSALGSFLAHPARTRRVRAGVRAVDADKPSRGSAARLRPPWWSSITIGLNRAGSAVAERSTDRSSERDLETSSLDELTGDEYAGIETGAPRWRSAMLGSFVVAVVLALLAARSLWSSGSLTAPALLPAGPGFWRAWLSPVPGSDLVNPPWLGWTALFQTVLRPDLFVTVALCGMVPLAIAACQPVLRRLTDDRRFRWWAAVTWALLPPLLGAENQGRLSLAVLAIVLPLLGLGIIRLGTRTGLRGAWGTGLGLAVATAFEPVLILPAAVGVVFAAVCLLIRHRRGWLRLIGRMLLALAVPVVLWAPWWVSLVRAGHPQRLLFGPDPGLIPATGSATPVPWLLLLGRPGGPGMAPLWLSAAVLGVLWLVALVGLALSGGRRAVLVGWVTALLCLAAAIGVSQLVATVPPLEIASRPWVGGLLLAGFAGLLVAGVVGAQEGSALLGRRSFGALQPLSVLAAVLVALVSVTAAGWYVWAGAAGPVHRTTLTALPSYVQNAQRNTGVRTLAIEVDGDSVSWSLVSDDQLRLGSAERGYAFGGSTQAQAQLDSVTRRLVGGAADEDIARTLTRSGVGYVWVEGASPAQQVMIGSAPGLVQASGTTGARVWRLAEPTGRALVIAEDTAAPVDVTSQQPHGGVAQVPAGAAARTLVLTEPSDPRWQVTLNGQPLPPAAAGPDAPWQQTYRLGADGGQLRWDLRAGPWPLTFGISQGALLVILLFLALPALRPEFRHPTSAARRVAGVARRAGAGTRLQDGPGPTGPPTRPDRAGEPDNLEGKPS